VDDILILYDQRKIDEQMILQKINGIDKNIQFRMLSEVNNTINPINTIHNLKTELINRKKKQKQQETMTPRNKWIPFTNFSPLVRRVTNLFKRTRLKIAFRATNTKQEQLTAKQTHSDASGIYQLKCNTCNKVYVGQSDRTVGVRFK